MTPIEHIRNFSIIAHIDHGKSTLADRILEKTGTIEKRQMKEQIMDSMELERERGVTIKSKAIRIRHTSRDGTPMILNLIDTPGHVDFSYEVSRALAACEGVLLLVDASQGIEAQTLAHGLLALEHNLVIIPVVNKVDLPSAEPEKVKQEIEKVFGIPASEVITASGKDGTGVDDILNAIVTRIPAPTGDRSAPLKGLIFDSQFDSYQGVIVYTRVFQGSLKAGQVIRMMGAESEFEVQEVGTFKITRERAEDLQAGDVGYVIAGMRNVSDATVGDTITTVDRPALEPLPGYRAIKPMVFCGFYPIYGEEYPLLRDALEKLKLNDAALQYEAETSSALGFGYRCGFLGLLHLEIVQERLEREYNVNLIATAPNVTYKIRKRNGDILFIDSPAKLPTLADIETIEEPYLKITLLTPDTYVGPLMELCTDKRGNFKNMEYLDPTRVMLTYEAPLAEVITDFHDRMKSCSKGYASLDYDFIGDKPSDLVKLDVLLAGEPVDALSIIIHKSKAQVHGHKLVAKLSKVIPRQQFDIPVQAAVGSRVIARETVRAMRKNVLAKCYGGDITRKRKLLEKQKEGKKRMKRVGTVDVPQEAFLAVLKVGGPE